MHVHDKNSDVVWLAEDFVNFLEIYHLEDFSRKISGSFGLTHYGSFTVIENVHMEPERQ